jgi:hypothetical protein
MLLSGYFERSLFGNAEKRAKAMAIIEDCASKSSGALIPIVLSSPRKGSFRNFFEKKLSKFVQNDPKVDNRLAYLVLKGVVLR